MAEPKKIRRVVTGHDAQGRSCVVYDSDVPNKFPRVTGTCFNELWTFEQVPVPLGGPDGGATGRPFLHSPPARGAHWRITDSPAKRIAHVVQACFNGRRIVVFSGGAAKDTEGLYDDARAIRDGGGSGVIIGRNSFQRKREDALKMLDTLVQIYQGKA